jgi:hypothetical protein
MIEQLGWLREVKGEQKILIRPPTVLYTLIKSIFLIFGNWRLLGDLIRSSPID